nr:hypothetical protein pSH12sh288-5_00002 [Shigella sonnei]
MANDHTESRQFIHEQLQLDRQRFQSLQTPEFLKQTRPVAPQEQSFLDAGTAVPAIHAARGTPGECGPGVLCPSRCRRRS